MKLLYSTVQVISHVRTGAHARILREQARLSLREVARRMRISAAYLSDLERGRRGWSAGLADRYSAALAGRS